MNFVKIYEAGKVFRANEARYWELAVLWNYDKNRARFAIQTYMRNYVSNPYETSQGSAPASAR